MNRTKESVDEDSPELTSFEEPVRSHKSLDPKLFNKIRYESPPRIYIYLNQMNKDQLFVILKQYTAKRKSIRINYVWKRIYRFFAGIILVGFSIIGTMGPYNLLFDRLGSSKMGLKVAVIIGTIWVYFLIWFSVTNPKLRRYLEIIVINQFKEELQETNRMIRIIKDHISVYKQNENIGFNNKTGSDNAKENCQNDETNNKKVETTSLLNYMAILRALREKREQGGITGSRVEDKPNE